MSSTVKQRSTKLPVPPSKGSSKKKSSGTRKHKSKKEVKGPSYCSIFLTVVILLALFPITCFFYNIISWPAATHVSDKSHYGVFKLSEEEIAAKKAELAQFSFDDIKQSVVDTEEGLVMSYLDEGSWEGDSIVFLHDAPLWSYTYRNVIPTLSMAKYRVVAVDLIGFGFSDKPTDPSVHTIANHAKWVTQLLDNIEMTNGVTLYAPGRAGLLAAALLDADTEGRFERLILSNAIMFTEEDTLPFFYHKIGQFLAEYFPYLSPIETVNWNIRDNFRLSVPEIASMDAPFPHHAYTVAWFPITQWSLPDGRAARHYTSMYEKFTKPVLILTGNEDEVGLEFSKWFLEHIPGTKDQPHLELLGKEYIQEDSGVKIADQIIKFCLQNPIVKTSNPVSKEEEEEEDEEE